MPCQCVPLIVHAAAFKKQALQLHRLGHLLCSFSWDCASRNSEWGSAILLEKGLFGVLIAAHVVNLVRLVDVDVTMESDSLVPSSVPS